MIISFIKNNIKKIGILIFTIIIIIILLVAFVKDEYVGEYVEWGEVLSDSNAIELLESNNIPYEIKNEMIYIPEDAFNKAIYCCA